MNSLIHADIFFFVTTIVVVLVGIVIAVSAVYAIRILKDVSDVVRKVRDEADRVTADIGSLRATIREEGQKFTHVSEFITNFMRAKKTRRERKKKETNNE